MLLAGNQCGRQYIAFVTNDPFIAVDLLGDTSMHAYLMTREGELVNLLSPADSIIDVHHGKELARLFHAEQYIEVPRIDHNDMLLVGLIATRYLDFLEGAVPAQQ